MQQTPDLEWKVIYVGSPEISTHDQTLEEILVGPIPAGVHKFVLVAPGPDLCRLPEKDVLGVTVVLVTCCYREQEFVRIGYYVSNELEEEEDGDLNGRIGAMDGLDGKQILRTILSDKPRVTRFAIDWGDDCLVMEGKEDSSDSITTIDHDSNVGASMEWDDDEYYNAHTTNEWGTMMSPEKPLRTNSYSQLVTPDNNCEGRTRVLSS